MVTRCTATTGMVVLLCIAAAGAALLEAQDQKSRARSVSGKWTMTLEGSAHGSQTMGLLLEQSGTRVTGTVATPHGDVAVEGEFRDDALKLATNEGGEDAPHMTLSAKLREDGTLAGYLSGPRGDMTWTARRSTDGR